MSEHPIIPQFLGGSEQRGGWQKLPLFKRDTLPPTTWLGTATHFHLWCDMWQMWIASMKLLKTTSRVLKMDFEIKRQLVCVTKFGCMCQPLTCLFTTKPREFKLILICEISQIFVWRNKAFIFFQKSDILFLQKTRINRDWLTLVVEVSMLNFRPYNYLLNYMTYRLGAR